ncbi:SET domain-containing protein SmydA-8-like [Palaemon carinicauda]|uniref:SET domain-containing protein SmydA-8-like n=1 Tax=Palaemon carinicauda TaxID=392227 RepID=UPI0035B5C62D
MESSPCKVCQKPATQSCSSCHASFYCSRECQKKDWRSHKESCIPYVIDVSPVYGRYPKATRDIKPGEIVIRDSVIVVGPRSDSRPLCLGCLRVASGIHFCSKCHFPQCSVTCKNAASHEAECLVLSKVCAISPVGSTKAIYEFILPLRCLLTRYTDPKKWRTLMALQDNLGSVTDEWKLRIRNNIIEYLNQAITFKDIEESDIYKICGMIQTNSIEVKLNGETVQGVFPRMAMLAHDCCPNTQCIFDSDMRAIVRSTVPIPKGAPITMCYTNIICNTIGRRQDLLISKFFECSCLRCSDPTEFGSNLSTLLCRQCGGHVLSTAPLISDAVWRCQDCNFTIASKDVRKSQAILTKAFQARDRSKLEPLEEMIDMSTGKLHTNHQIIIEAKLAWIKFCGNHPDFRYKDLSKIQLETKISFCRDLLKVADLISPGKSNFRGHVLYELHAALKTMARKLLSFGDLNNEKTEVYFDEAENRLQESRGIFCTEIETKELGIKEKLALLTKDLEGIC